MCAKIVTECAKPVTQISFQLPEFQRIAWNITQNITHLIAAHILQARLNTKKESGLRVIHQFPGFRTARRIL
jgi:hypothetical protein